MGKFEKARKVIFAIFEEATGGLKPNLDTDMGELDLGVEGIWQLTEEVFGLEEGWTEDGQAVNKTLEDYIRHVVSKWDGKILDDRWTKHQSNSPHKASPELVKAFTDFSFIKLEDIVPHIQDVNSRFEQWDSCTVLHKACEWYRSDLVDWLLAHGADPNAKTFLTEETPLHWSCKFHGDAGIVKRLIQGGANINDVDEKGWTALHFAVYSENDPEITAILLAAGADTTIASSKARSEYGDSKIPKGAFPIYAALVSGNEQAMRSLFPLPGGSRDANENTLLHLAAADKSVSCADQVSFLVDELGIDLNAVNKFGWTALHYACSPIFSADFVYELLKRGAKTDIVSTKRHKKVSAGSTPLDAAKASEQYDAKDNSFNFYDHFLDDYRRVPLDDLLQIILENKDTRIRTIFDNY